MDALTTIVELGVGIACVVLGVGVARARPAPAIRILGGMLTVAGVVAAWHAVAVLT